MTPTREIKHGIDWYRYQTEQAIARAEAAEANLLSVREALADMIDERDAALAEVVRLRALVATLQGTLGFAAQYIAKAHADGAYNNTAMSGERALRIIGEALTDNTRQDAT